MTTLPERPSKKFLDAMNARARYILRRAGEGAVVLPETKKVDRQLLKSAEEYARGILTCAKRNAATLLAKDVLVLVHNVDSLAAEIYPVFEMIDRVLFQENGSLVVKDGWRLYDNAGYLLSSGDTLREMLIDHITRYGENVTMKYDPREDGNFKLEKEEPRN